MSASLPNISRKRTDLGDLVIPIIRLPIHRPTKERLGNHETDVGVVRIQLVRPQQVIYRQVYPCHQL
jgi:hypothetical protein